MAKVMISIPDDLLGEVDREAKRRSTTRSGLLQKAVRREVRSTSADGIDQAVGELRRRAARYKIDQDPAKLVRQERDVLADRHL